MNVKKDINSPKTNINPNAYDEFFSEVFKNIFTEISVKDKNLKNKKYENILEDLNLKDFSTQSLEVLYKHVGEIIKEKKQEPVYQVSVTYPDSSYDAPFTVRSLNRLEDKLPKNFKEVKIVKTTVGSTMRV